jgi:1-acyl-sn-glycerol-3-phosphate acyltransferase
MGYLFARFLIRLLLRLIVRIEVRGAENIPASGAFIGVSNHLGRLDAPLAFYFLDRKDIVMMVAEKYRESAISRWFVKHLDAIWVDRFNADLGAMREALNRLKQGAILVMAPEGTRSPTGALIEGRAGAGYLAIKAEVPILPVAVTGTEDVRAAAQLRRFRRVQVVARVGKPFRLPPFKRDEREAAIQQSTDEIMCRLAALLPPEYRGMYADHPRLKELLSEEAA